MGPSTFSAYCSAILLGFNSIAVDEKAKSFLKHIDTFKRLIINHQDSIDKHYNKMEQSYKKCGGDSTYFREDKNRNGKSGSRIKRYGR